MKKVIALVLAVLLVLSVSAFAAQPSKTTKDLKPSKTTKDLIASKTTKDLNASKTTDNLIIVNISAGGIVRIPLTETAEAFVEEALLTSVKDVFGVDGELEALISFSVFNAEACEMTIELLQELTEEDNITVLVGLTTGEDTVWQPMEFVLSEGKLVVSWSAEIVEAAELADAVTVAVIVA